MPLGTDHLLNTSASVEDFVPQLWSDDVIAAYKSNLVVANLVRKINHVGKKGDALNLPAPTRGSANAKAAGDQITLNQNNSATIAVNLGVHYEYSVIIEDILEVQALSSLRRFHTDDAGYALAKQVDSDLIAAFSADENGISVSASAISGNDTAWAGAGTAQSYYNNSGALGDYNEGVTAATAVTDPFIRAMTQTLDDADVPMSGRVMVVSPPCKGDLIGIDRFTEQAFVGEVGQGNTIRNGRVGDIYGAEVFVTSNLPTVDTAAERVNLYFHPDAVIFAEQSTMRSQAQYKQEYLGTLMTSDCIYGVQKARDEAGMAFVTPNS